MNETLDGLHIVMLSIHGLVRGHDMELGRDPDTGGQIKYVVELAQALGERPEVARVDLLTRRVVDPEVDPSYAESEEHLSERVRIIRLDAGPPGYIPKEELWDHLDGFADNAIHYFREHGLRPSLIHGHYADAGYAASRIAHLLEVPLVFTGHSLGRVKRRRLLASGLGRDEIEARYHMARRIEAEENALGAAQLVIASTRNEIEEQYALYDRYQTQRMRVVPPGTDLTRFRPPAGDEGETPIAEEVRRFLREPDRPLILAISRPDERKNIGALLTAFGESDALRRTANLVVVAGNRDDVRELPAGPQSVLTEVLHLVDRYDLYGLVAYPKHHRADDVPILYRLAALSRGVFVNPALTEPFGLTLIEAAASGLPIVATEDGGPRDIIGHCHNGVLVDPLDTGAIAESLRRILEDDTTWRVYAENGLKGVRRHYSWEAHAEAYLERITPLIRHTAEPTPTAPRRRPMLYHDRAIFTDLDQNLLGDPSSLARFVQVVRDNRKCATFGIATGRSLESALKVMRRFGIPEPDVLITGVGAEIHYAPALTADKGWSRHIDFQWNPRAIRHALEALPGLHPQPKEEQGRYKISYYLDTSASPSTEEIARLLHHAELSANLFLSFGQFLDLTPLRASKGFALRWFANQWGIPVEHILAAGGSGTDEDMLRGNTLGVVVANRHHEELSHLTDIERIYFARQGYAAGILEAIEHYDFFGACRVPEEGEG